MTLPWMAASVPAGSGPEAWGRVAQVPAVLVDASEGWRGVRMKPYLEERLRQIAVDPDSAWQDPDIARLAA